MNRLELLWELEKHNVNLESVIQQIEDLNRELKEQRNEKRFEDTNRTIKILDNNMGIIKTSILKYENSLSQYEYEINSLNDKLYKGDITDIKQLEYLGFEKEEMEKKLKEIETKMLIYMEEEEILEKRYNDSTTILEELEKTLQKGSFAMEDEIKALEKKSREEQNDVSKIIEKLDADSIKRYNDLKERKNRPIVLIKDNICSGCNMRLPTYQLEELKIKGKIINCESCGRIFYLRDE